MKKNIIGIGNAIVDVVCKVDDNFLKDLNLVKGSMSLISKGFVEKLSKLQYEKISSGGSVCNTIATLGELGCNAYFLGTIANDEIGKKFSRDLELSNAKFIGKIEHDEDSAVSYILVTPDGQRTMCTFLGCASIINEDDIFASNFHSAEILYIEGYLWDNPNTINSLKKAIKIAKKNNTKIIFSLSDIFCVQRHKKYFIDLIKNDLNIVFCNENEFLNLIDKSKLDLNDLKQFHNSINKDLTIIITRSEKGCIVCNNGNIIEIIAKKITSIIDTTGAGDIFASGFIYGLINHLDINKCCNYGNFLAGQIIQKFGARFNKNEINKIKYENIVESL